MSQNNVIDLVHLSDTVTTTNTSKINLRKLSKLLAEYHSTISSENMRTVIDEVKDMLKLLPKDDKVRSMRLSWSSSSKNRIIFQFEYWHGTENDCIDLFTSHILTITPEFGGYLLNISGYDKDYIKGELYELFRTIFD